MTESNGQERPGGAAVRTADGPAEWFLAGVRTALADLPAAEVDDILADVRAHLADLATELGSAFDRDAVVARLGTPAAYAAELRSAAGYPPAPQAPERGRRGAARAAVFALLASTLTVVAGTLFLAPAVVLLGAVLVLIALPALVREGPRMPTVAALPVVRRFLAAVPRPGTAGRAFADFVASLQPSWWIARALLAALLVTAAFAVDAVDLFVTVVVAAPAVAVSVWLGRLSGRDRRLLWVVVPLNGFAVAVVLIIVGTQTQPWSVVSEGPAPAYYGPSGLWQDGEREILDIVPFDSTGTPLSGVYLYDQDGNPIVTRDEYCEVYPDWSPGESNDRRPYPRGTTWIEQNTGECVVAPPSSWGVVVPGEVTLTPRPPTPSDSAQAPTTTSPTPPTPTG